MVSILLLTLLALAACSSGSREVKPNNEPLADILEVRDTYLSLLPEVQHEHGFIYSHDSDCDSLLFTGLVVASGGSANYRAAQDHRTPGRWYRTPYQDCYANSQSDNGSGRKSGSTTSIDMLAGLLWAAYSLRDLGIANDLISYGKKNLWFMGYPKGDRTFFWPPHRQTLYAVAGKSYGAEKIDYIDPRKDHARHVLALYMILEGEVRGKLSSGNADLLVKLAKADPQNALFQYGKARFSTGDFAPALTILRDESLFPRERLPTSSDRCGRWLWERKASHAAWRPCAERSIHSGGDFLFITKLLELASEERI